MLFSITYMLEMYCYCREKKTPDRGRTAERNLRVRDIQHLQNSQWIVGTRWWSRNVEKLKFL